MPEAVGMTQMHICRCGRFGILREQHRPDGSLPSHDRYRKQGYERNLLCQDCIEAALLSEAERRRIRARTKALLERRKRLVLT